MKIQQDRSTKRPSELVKQNPPNHYAALQPRVGAVDLHTPAQPTCTPSLKETARRAGKCPTTPPHPSLRSPEDLPLPSRGALCVNSRRACMAVLGASAQPLHGVLFLPQTPACASAAEPLRFCATRCTAAGKKDRDMHNSRGQANGARPSQPLPFG
jgi:hypothetical protein